jgi:hypothetical protein
MCDRCLPVSAENIKQTEKQFFFFPALFFAGKIYHLPPGSTGCHDCTLIMKRKEKYIFTYFSGSREDQPNTLILGYQRSSDSVYLPEPSDHCLPELPGPG